jgi:hypothetical protein
MSIFYIINLQELYERNPRKIIFFIGLRYFYAIHRGIGIGIIRWFKTM